MGEGMGSIYPEDGDAVRSEEVAAEGSWMVAMSES